MIELIVNSEEMLCGSILVLKSLKTSNNMAEIEEYEYKIQYNT